MWVPAGFAHGFYVLSDSADFLYKTTDYYIPDLERSLAWNDPQVAVSWPIDKDTQPIVSAKDIKATKLTDAEVFA
jgi:dTDP-4-dehydrorhamnose 3,5-epimerase